MLHFDFHKWHLNSWMFWIFYFMEFKKVFFVVRRILLILPYLSCHSPTYEYILIKLCHKNISIQKKYTCFHKRSVIASLSPKISHVSSIAVMNLLLIFLKSALIWPSQKTPLYPFSQSPIISFERVLYKRQLYLNIHTQANTYEKILSRHRNAVSLKLIKSIHDI